MSWVSTAKLSTLCETIKTYIIGQANDAYTKAETKMSTDYVAKSGSTMTGALNVIEPVEDSNASTKKYVDDAIASVDHSTFLKKTGDTMSGTLDMGENTISNVKTPTAVGDAANKSYVDEALASASGGYIQTFVKKSGDTMTGTLDMSGNSIDNVLAPSNDGQAANKKYVDTQDAKKVNTSDEMTDTELATIEAIFA